MTPEVRERIEQIRHGNVPDGYKKTKVGIFPCEWNVQPLCKLLEFKNGINADKEKFGQGTKLISVRDILSDYPITYETIQCSVDVNEQQIEEFGVKYGDVLFQRSSENYEDAGTSNVYLDPNNTAVFSGFVIRGKKVSEYNPVYLNALLRTSYVRKAIIRQAAGAQHINIGQASLAKVHIALADDPEQKKIAAILTTQDKVIELKEKRLAEKQRQKKHLMQQLLNGKKRLPGFDDEWKQEKLGKLFAERSETKCEHLELLAITGTQGVIPRSQLDMKDNSSEDKSKYLHICVGDIGYNTMRMWQGVSAYSNYEGIVSPAYTILKPKSNINAKYFAYLFKMPEVVFLFYRYSQGLVDDTRNLKYENFKKISVTYPKNIEEQNAIVSVFESTDKEINLLLQAIEQEKQKKRVLMQLLLTGIVRMKI